MTPLVIHVIGQSSISRVAERAKLSISVSSTEKTQALVSEQVTSTSNELREIFENLAPKNAEGLATDDAPVTQFSMGAFSTSSCVPRDKQGNELDREYTASSKFTAIFRDFSKLGEITSALFRMPHVEVDNTQWHLTQATMESLGSQSRKAAMQDAIQKAKDYADVVGKSPVAVEIKDDGSQSYGRTKQTARRARSDTSGFQAIAGPLTIEPEDVELRASIEVKFEAV